MNESRDVEAEETDCPVCYDARGEIAQIIQEFAGVEYGNESASFYAAQDIINALMDNGWCHD
jgi:hypothetical protein